MELLSNPGTWIALITLTILEIVLGIDNIIFIAILAGKLGPDQKDRARIVGLSLALITRILLLLTIGMIAKATVPFYTLPLNTSGFSMDPKQAEEMLGISWRDLILFAGGLFLIYKSVKEVHHQLEGQEEEGPKTVRPTFWATIVQIILLDIVFSLDSVITAVGMVNDIPIMITAVVIAVIIMLFFSGKLAAFVDRHPTIKMLALSFLILIGFNLILDAAGQHIPKGYTYFAMAFSVVVELLNIKLRGSTPRFDPIPDEPSIAARALDPD
ncbi:TerC family protein [bacterium]|nr:MAG: TerC family protein [bacterium]